MVCAAYHAEPVLAQDLCDVGVAETAFDQQPGDRGGVAVVEQIRREVHGCKLLLERCSFLGRHRPVDEVEEVEPETDWSIPISSAT